MLRVEDESEKEAGRELLHARVANAAASFTQLRGVTSVVAKQRKLCRYA